MSDDDGIDEALKHKIGLEFGRLIKARLGPERSVESMTRLIITLITSPASPKGHMERGELAAAMALCTALYFKLMANGRRLTNRDKRARGYAIAELLRDAADQFEAAMGEERVKTDE